MMSNAHMIEHPSLHINHHQVGLDRLEKHHQLYSESNQNNQESLQSCQSTE